MLRLSRRIVLAGLILAVIYGLALGNHNLKDSYQDLLIQAGIAVTLAVSLNIVNGFTGQFSIGHAGFMAVGAYAGGALTYPIWVAAKKALAAAHPNWSDLQVLNTFSSSNWWLLPTSMLIGGVVAAAF